MKKKKKTIRPSLVRKFFIMKIMDKSILCLKNTRALQLPIGKKTTIGLCTQSQITHTIFSIYFSFSSKFLCNICAADHIYIDSQPSTYARSEIEKIQMYCNIKLKNLK